MLLSPISPNQVENNEFYLLGCPEKEYVKGLVPNTQRKKNDNWQARAIQFL